MRSPAVCQPALSINTMPCAPGHGLCEFSQKQVHRSGVEPGHHQGDTTVACRAYGPDDPSRLVADITQPARGMAGLSTDLRNWTLSDIKNWTPGLSDVVPTLGRSGLSR